MGSSSAEFSLFLGFGEQTVAKYEAGTLPDELHSNTMRMASTKEGARCCSASMAIGSRRHRGRRCESASA